MYRLYSYTSLHFHITDEMTPQKNTDISLNKHNEFNHS
jgi:hypothetical protein